MTRVYRAVCNVPLPCECARPLLWVKGLEVKPIEPAPREVIEALIEAEKEAGEK